MQFQDWILQCIRNPKIRKARPERTQDDFLGSTASHDQPSDHYVVASLDEGARGDVSEPYRWWSKVRAILSSTTKL